jgi:hypothetical protein
VRAGKNGLSLSEIEDRWESRFDLPYSRRTFNNHRDAVEEVFGIRIECNRSTNRYYIDYSEDVSDENAETAWLINTFTVNSMLSMGKQRLSGRVSVEDIPSGHIFLTAIMEAMTDGVEIEIDYQKYSAESAESLTLRPYAVKEFAKRWYLVAYCEEREALRVYGLDRIKAIDVIDKAFKMPKNFDVDETFATSFGPYLSEGKAQLITFRTTKTEARFLRDLPLHESQEEIKSDDKEHVTFRIFVWPNKSLIMELCKFGSGLEVLSPAEVRDAVAEQLSAALQLYKKQQ